MNGFAWVHEAPRRGRVEVPGGPPKGRRYSTEEKAALVAASLEPGASVWDLARRRGMHPQAPFPWRRLAREGKLALPAQALPMFAAVVAADDAAPTAPAASGAAPIPDAGSGESSSCARCACGSAPARVAALVAALRAAP